MTDISELYKIADKNGTEIIVGTFPKNKSFSVMDEYGETFIGIHKRFSSQADRRVHLAHEIGHCVRGAFYNKYSEYDVRLKYERQADEWAITRLVPQDDFFAACRAGAQYPYEIAEEFNITPQFAEKVMRYYLHLK